MFSSQICSNTNFSLNYILYFYFTNAVHLLLFCSWNTFSSRYSSCFCFTVTVFLDLLFTGPFSWWCSEWRPNFTQLFHLKYWMSISTNWPGKCILGRVFGKCDWFSEDISQFSEVSFLFCKSISRFCKVLDRGKCQTTESSSYRCYCIPKN